MQEIWGRRIVWGGTHRPPNPPPPNTSTTLETPSPFLGDGWPDCLLINWIVSLINGQDKDEAAKYATAQLYTHRRMWEYLIKSTRHLIMAFVMENWFKRMYCPSLLTSITPNVQWDEEEWSQGRRQKDEWSRRSSNQPNKRSKLKYQSQPPHSPTY